MGALNGLAFLPLFSILGWLGLITYWLTKCAGETELGLETEFGELNVKFSLEITSHGVATPLTVWFTLPEVPPEMCAQLRAVSVTLFFRSTVLRRLNISCTPVISTVMGGLIGRMTTDMIFGTNRLINIFVQNFRW